MASEMKHTPSESLFLDGHDSCLVLASGVSDTIDAPVYSVIAKFLPADQRDEDGREWRCEGDAKANARLFLVAGELLRACELWDQGFVDGEQFDETQFLRWVNENRRAARAAIAKYRGS